jgi:hypothetical protein
MSALNENDSCPAVARKDLRHHSCYNPSEGEVVEFCQVDDDCDHDGPCVGDDEEQCHHGDCEAVFCKDNENDYIYIKGDEPIYVCNSCYKENKEHYDEIEAEYASDADETDESESDDE